MDGWMDGWMDEKSLIIFATQVYFVDDFFSGILAKSTIVLLKFGRNFNIYQSIYVDLE